uniref:glutamate formimidoyltransferase n=1 Tax=Arundo donax TaxID=35708 RepID=A0A0A9CMB5_ARUDO
MLPSSHQQKCCNRLEFPQKNVVVAAQQKGRAEGTTMLRPALACCKLYISEARNEPALRAIERAAAGLRPAAVLVNAFADDAYNRVGYTLVSSLAGGGGAGDSAPPPLHRAAFGVVAAALEAVDFGSHAGAHPRLGVVDHVAFHPLAGAKLDDVAALTRAVAADIGDKLQVPTYLYGAADREGRTLASIRRQLGYFTPNSPGDQWRGAPEASSLPVAPDAGPSTPSRSKGVVVVGATAWVDNYNVPVHTSDVGAAKRIARAVSERGGGLRAVQAMGLAHDEGVTEVACNLLDPARVGAEQVQERVRQLAAEQGLAVGKGYFTDFSQEKIVELYLQKSAEAEATQQ